jgi:hypothetical protein
MSFYFHQANKRMQDDPVTTALVRFAIKRFWTLVGSGVAGGDNLAFVAAQLFGSEVDLAALKQAERLIRQLPGMSWFELLSRQASQKAAEYQATLPPPPRVSAPSRGEAVA